MDTPVVIPPEEVAAHTKGIKRRNLFGSKGGKKEELRHAAANDDPVESPDADEQEGTPTHTRRGILARTFDGFTAALITDVSKGAALVAGGAFLATGVDGYMNMSAESPERLQLLSDQLDLRMFCAPTSNTLIAKDRLNEGFRVVYSNIIRQIKSDKSATSFLLYHIGLPTDRINDTSSSTFSSAITKSVGNGLGIFLEELLKAVPGEDSYTIIRDAVVDHYPDPNPVAGEIDKAALLVSLDKIYARQKPAAVSQSR